MLGKYGREQNHWRSFPIDIRKAFDSINHQFLLLKIENLFGVQDSELIWFASYLSNREQACYVNGHMSSRNK
jgi:hypothetical protein